MDRTGLEFNLSFVSLQNKNSSHCHHDIVQKPPKRVRGFPFRSWSGWGDVFNCVVALRKRSQLAEHCAASVVSIFSQFQSLQRIPMSDGRSRDRRRRGLIRDMLRSCIECSLRWLQTGCLRLSEARLGRSLRQLASRAAKEACCTSPLDFVRGQARALAGDTREHREMHSTFFKFWFFTIQCRALAMELRWDLESACRTVTHPISKHCFARSRVCRYAGDCSVIQCSRCDRSAHFTELLKCFYALVEICGPSYGEM